MKNKFSTGVDEGGRVFLQDSDFENDARLYVNGDFYDQEEELNYANKIAKILNANKTDDVILVEHEVLTDVIINSIQELHERVLKLESK